MNPTNRIIQIADYQLHPRNYNKHPAIQVERIAVSLRTFGQVRSVVVWRNYFLAGHGVREGALLLGWTELRADVLPDDYPEELALAYVAADNELGRLSDPDQAQLLEILSGARDYDDELLAAIGYDDKEFQSLLGVLSQASDDDWSSALSSLPAEDRAPFQQMIFTLHDSQVEQVKRAIGIAAKIKDFADSPNQNRNGNALAVICETFVTEHDDS